MLLQLTEQILPPHRIWISENLCYSPPTTPPPTESIWAKLGLPPKWMLARTPMYITVVVVR